MQDTFYNANSFNQPLDWDTSSVKMMAGTFSGASDFNQPLVWDTSSATTMYVTFRNANAFNQRGIADWDVGRVSEFSNTFGTTALANDACSRQLVAKAWEGNTAFTSAYPSWDSTGGCPPSPPSLPPPPPKGVFEDKATLSAAVSDWIANEATAEATHGASSGWDTSRVDDLSYVFTGTASYDLCPFNDDIGAWDTAAVTSLVGTFRYSEFNGAIGGWDTSKVTNMAQTFAQAFYFNSELAWDTSKVTDMGWTIMSISRFNQPLVWDTSSVTNMDGTFWGAGSFNKGLVWDTSSVVSMSSTFFSAYDFNQPGISAWDIGQGDDGMSPRSRTPAGSFAKPSDWAYPSWERRAWRTSLPPPPPKGVFEGQRRSARRSTGSPYEQRPRRSQPARSASTTAVPLQHAARLGHEQGEEMYYTFNSAEAFNSPLDWDTSQVTMECPPSTMACPDDAAIQLNQPLAWDTSKVKNVLRARFFNGTRARWR